LLLLLVLLLLVLLLVVRPGALDAAGFRVWIRPHAGTCGTS
jgi:hypothetical protein